MLNICVYDGDKIGLARISTILTDFFEKRRINNNITAFEETELLTAEQENAVFDLAVLDISDKKSREKLLRCTQEMRKKYSKTKLIFISGDPYAAFDISEYKPDYLVYRTDLGKKLPAALAYLYGPEENKNSLVIETKSTKYIIPEDKILYFEHYQHDTKIICEDGVIVCHEKLADLHKRLDQNSFARSHCSFLVNLNHVREYRRTQLLMSNGATTPCSRANQKTIGKAIADLHKSKVSV